MKAVQRLILASQSASRADLLRQIGYEFEVIPSDYEEDMTQPVPAAELAKILALGKAQDVAKKVSHAVIVAGDSFIEFDGKLQGKPHTADKAREVLHGLSGQTNTAYSGFAVIDTDTGRTVNEVRSCKVTFRELTDEEIEAYVATGEPLNKGGAYAMTLRGAALVDRVEGDIYAVAGLPLGRLAKVLQDFGIPLPW